FIPLISSKDNIISTEAAIKYFIIQVIASSILLTFVILDNILLILNKNMINSAISIPLCITFSYMISICNRRIIMIKLFYSNNMTKISSIYYFILLILSTYNIFRDNFILYYWFHWWFQSNINTKIHNLLIH
ncbi:NADH-ubiquinone oxidoreductase chain 2, partial [Gryllus bimaculatus]